MQRPSLALAQAIEHSFDIALSDTRQPAAAGLQQEEGQLASAWAGAHGRSLAEQRGEQARSHSRWGSGGAAGWEGITGLRRQGHKRGLGPVTHAYPAAALEQAQQKGHIKALPAGPARNAGSSADRRSLLGATREDSVSRKGLHLHFDIAIHVRTFSRYVLRVAAASLAMKGKAAKQRLPARCSCPKWVHSMP